MNLLEDPKHTSIYGNVAQNIYPSTWMWGKAHTTPEGDAMCMSGAFSCKDHLVDLYMNQNTHLSQKRLWSDKQNNENCYYVIPTNAGQARLLQANILAVLNSYEKKHKIALTVCIPLKNPQVQRALFLIKGSQMWYRNATSLSMYLSLIRLCGQTENMTSFDFTKGTNNNNERHYYNSLKTDKYRELYTHYYNNPRLFMVKPTAPFYKTTQTASYVAHGASGLHYMFNQVHELLRRLTSKLCNEEYVDTTVNASMFLPMIYKELEEVYVHVEVQRGW